MSGCSTTPPPADLGRWRVLLTADDAVYASRAHTLYVSRDAGASFQPAGALRVGLRERLLAAQPLAARLLRTGFHHLTRLPNGDLLAIVRGAVVRCPAGTPRFEVTHVVRRGVRPLSLGRAPSGRLFFGEYFGNRERDEVHVYGSDDGRSWEVAHTFRAGSIRHVHGVHADPYLGGLWVLTGDDGDEAGIWWTDDEFRTLEPVVRGTQRARAVALLPTKDGPLVPTDTPAEQNLVQRLDPATGRLEPLAELPGTVFFAARTPRLHLVSTVLEPSPVNTARHVALLASADGGRWRTVARLARDLPALRDVRGYLQYPTLRLPGGAAELPWVFATGQSVAGATGRLLRWSEEALLRALEAPAEVAA